MHVHVDEPGRNHLAPQLNTLRSGRREAVSNAVDAAVRDQQIKRFITSGEGVNQTAVFQKELHDQHLIGSMVVYVREESR